MVKVLHWNGHDVPGELAELPPGRYVLAPIDEGSELSAAEDAEVQAGVDEIERGASVDGDDVAARLRAKLRTPSR